MADAVRSGDRMATATSAKVIFSISLSLPSPPLLPIYHSMSLRSLLFDPPLHILSPFAQSLSQAVDKELERRIALAKKDPKMEDAIQVRTKIILMITVQKIYLFKLYILIAEI